jgi:hypothetical protein
MRLWSVLKVAFPERVSGVVVSGRHRDVVLFPQVASWLGIQKRRGNGWRLTYSVIHASIDCLSCTVQ